MNHSKSECVDVENHLRTERVDVVTGMIAIRRMRTAWSTITARSVEKIADARGIVSGRARGSGVVKGTACWTAFRVTARAITIGAVAPIADTAAITLPLFTLVIVIQMRSTAVTDVAVRVTSYCLLFSLFNSRCD